jgi:hypothetical protein
MVSITASWSTTKQVEMARSSLGDVNTYEQICRAFHTTTSPEEVCRYLRRVMDPSTLEDTYLTRPMPMYYDTLGNAKLQSSLPMACDETNADYGQFEDGDGVKKPATDGHYWSKVLVPLSPNNSSGYPLKYKIPYGISKWHFPHVVMPPPPTFLHYTIQKYSKCPSKRCAYHSKQPNTLKVMSR